MKPYFWIVPALFLTACSTKTSLSYTPIIEQKEKNYIQLATLPFDDTRLHPETVGALRVVLGMPLIKIVTDDSVPNWVENALKEELTQASMCSETLKLNLQEVCKQFIQDVHATLNLAPL